MNSNEIIRNIIVSVVGGLVILSLFIFEIFSCGLDIDFYQIIIMGFGFIIFSLLLISSLKERKKNKKILQELDVELKSDN